MIKLLNMDNMDFETGNKFDYIYCDMIYENKDMRFIDKFWAMMKPNAIFAVQTDFHTVFDVGSKLQNIHGSFFVSHYAWKNEWGRPSSIRPHQCFDDIILFSNGEKYKYYPQKAQVSKATANSKGLNPSGRVTKAATAFISDITLTTTAKERVRNTDGHLVRWQKPLKLFDRIVKCYVDDGDDILDPFMGVGSLAEWSVLNNCNYVGIEYDKAIFELAEDRIGL